jgi:hypothetical protein
METKDVFFSAKTQLKAIGEQIEAVAKKLESEKNLVDCEGLYEIGNQVEHFLDNIGAEKLIAKPKIDKTQH